MSIPLISAPSAALSLGRITRSKPCSRAIFTIGSIPLTGRISPSRDSSPITSVFSGSKSGICPYTPSIATAIGRSKAEPDLCSSAGERLIVIFIAGRLMPLFLRETLTRLPASLTSLAKRPIISRPGRPGDASTSTVIRSPKIPPTLPE